jgi:PAS domain S-box-containing protein
MARGSIRLLFVEDDRVDRMAFERFVREHKFDCSHVIACNVAEAAAAIAAGPFDVIVSDYMLPDGTAEDVLALAGEVPLIVITGSGSEEIAVRVIRKGAADYMTKDPQGHHLKVLPVTVENAIKHKAQEKALLAYHEKLEEMVRERTEHLEREIGLRQEAENLVRIKNAAIETSVTPLGIARMDGTVEYVNPAFVKQFGLKSAEEAAGKPLADFGPPERVREFLTAVMADGFHSGDSVGVRSDGSEFPMMTSVSLIRDENGAPIRLFASFADISRQKEAEGQLRRTGEEQQLYSERLSILLEAVNRMGKVADFDELCREAVVAVRDRIGADRAGLWFYSDDGTSMRGSFGTDEKGGIRDERDLTIEIESRWKDALPFGERPRLLVENADLYNHLGNVVGTGLKATAGLWNGDRIIGFLAVDNLFSRRPFTEYDQKLILMFAAALGHLCTLKRTEDTLRTNEEKFRRLFETESDALFLIRKETGEILEANSAAVRMYGYDREELLRLRNADLSFDPDLPLKAVREECPAIPVYPHRRKDGNSFPAEITTAFFDFRSERVCLAAVRDISDRVQAELALHESERRLSTLISNLRGMVYRCLNDRNWTMEFVSEGARDLTGYSAADLVENRVVSFNDLIHPDDREAVRSEVRKALAGDRPFHLEYRIRRADGSEIWVQELGRGIPDQSGPGVTLEGFISNDNDRKQAENELIRSESRYRSIFENIQDVYYEVGLDGRVLEVSPSIKAISGYRREQLIGTDLFDLYVNHDDRIRLLDQIRKAGWVHDFEVTLRDADGAAVPCSINSIYLAGVGDASGRIVGSMRDIRERKQFEGRLMTSLKEKDILLKEVHHRVKNNMQIIVSLLNLQSAKIEDPAVLGAFAVIRQRIYSMALLHEILYKSQDFSKIGLGNYLSSLAAELLRAYHAAERIGLSLDLEDTAVGLDTAVPVGLIVNEIITNAIKHAFPDFREGRIAIDLKVPDGNRIVLTVSDDGVGMPASPDPAREETLGLKIIRVLTEQLDGANRTESGNGTRWILEFPAGK